MSEKNKKAGKGKPPEPDVETLDRYVSERDEKELGKFQTLKSALFYVGTALFFITLFMPSDVNAAPSAFVAVFAVINIIAAAFAIDLMYQDNRKYKIRKTVLKKQAPRYGFDKQLTYLIVEIYCALIIVLLAEQCVIVAYARDGFAIAGLVLMILSVGCILASRFILVQANCGKMQFIEAEKKEEGESAETVEPAEEEAENAEEMEKSADTVEDCDDFYAPPKE